MASPSTARRSRSARSARRSLRWEYLREYAAGALWVLPTLAAVVALLGGLAMSQIEVEPGTLLDRLAFQGTADDARTLLVSVSSTVVTVIALVLGLTVVALQLSSTAFSPRLLRNFLRDRATQIVLSVFIATFVYSAAGLFTVGLSAGTRTEEFPRLAISGAIVLLFASLGMVVYFADHLMHSIQIDAINKRVVENTRRVLREMHVDTVGGLAPRAPEWAVPLPARKSGYVQTVHPELLLPVASQVGVTICLRTRVGQHVVAGTTLGWVWAPTAEDPRPDPEPFEEAVNTDVRIGFERTLEQDVAFGIRQQLDIACKALSPAVNDPYTAVQAVNHLSEICCEIAMRPLGADILTDTSGRGRVVVPGNTFRDYLYFICGVMGRYGAHDVTVMTSLSHLVRSCTEILPAGSDRLGPLHQAAGAILVDAKRGLVRPSDVESIRRTTESLLIKIAAKQSPGIRPTVGDSPLSSGI
ncbi:MAG TPA: DUF2254 domain-containing protein [Propionibacteriaceae bacterium]|nr:DUF2254 domain-containing protein [Propionibacteriaceae bacterium]